MASRNMQNVPRANRGINAGVNAAVTIGPATEADAPALLAIYRPYVEATAVSFETDTPTNEEFATRIAKTIARWQWLVAERGGESLGYAYGSLHRERPSYRWSVEVSAYAGLEHQRQGIGRSLYLRLFDELAQRGFAMRTPASQCLTR
jgi:L-amino acid N-acyltransferase YncA